MTQQFGKLTAEDLDCYRELFSGITKKIQRLCRKKLFLPATRKSLEEIYQRSLDEKNREYCRNIRGYLDVYQEPYPDLDNLVNFFNDNEKDVSIDSNISD